MAYSTPPTFVDGAVLPASQLNNLGDDISYLYGVSTGVTFSGFKVSRSTSQSIPDSTDTTITFDTEVFDYGGWYSSGSTGTLPSGAVPASFTNIAVLCIVRARFVSNSTGYRTVHMLKDGTNFGGITGPSLSGDATELMAIGLTTAAAAAAFTMQVKQTSGGNLNCDIAELIVVRFAPAS